ncbi:carbohydrate binding domain-containing protein [Bifidobacterium sp.]|uniref:carbohydrate binding domain-containing protein n=1 Tax=Bifidobacterium sp. TaxID=41200 RepID=UPI0039ECB0F5
MTYHPSIVRKDTVSLALDTANAAVRIASKQLTSNAGTVEVPNADGTSTIIGAGAGDTGVAQWVGDTTPPGTPTGITATSGSGMIVVSWDGTLDGGIPADFAHVTIIVDGVASGNLAAAGSLTFGVYDSGSVHAISAIAYDDAHAEDGSSAPNASAPMADISITVKTSEIDPSQLGITITKTTVAASATTPGVHRGDLWLQYDGDPTASGVALVAEWWWDGTAWQAIPIAMYLDQLAVRDIQADSAVIGMLSAGIITSGLFQTASSGARSSVDTSGFHTYDSDGNVTFDTTDGNVSMINATAKNMTVTDMQAVGGSISLTPTEVGAATTLYSQDFETSSGLTGWIDAGDALTLSTEQKYSGSQSLKSTSFVPGLSLQKVISPSLLTGGATYTFDYWVYSPTSDNSLPVTDLFWWGSNSYQQIAESVPRKNGWTHVTASANVPYGATVGTDTGYPEIVIAANFVNDSKTFLTYIDAFKVIRTPFGAGSYYGLDDAGYPKLEMYDDDGSVLISLKAADGDATGGKVNFNVKNGIYLGMNSQQPELNIDSTGTGLSSSTEVDIAAPLVRVLASSSMTVNDNTYGTDTGWLDLASKAWTSSTMQFRVIDGKVYVRGMLAKGSGTIAANSTNNNTAVIPSAAIPPVNTIVLGNGYSSALSPAHGHPVAIRFGTDGSINVFNSNSSAIGEAQLNGFGWLLN